MTYWAGLGSVRWSVGTNFSSSTLVSIAYTEQSLCATSFWLEQNAGVYKSIVVDWVGSDVLLTLAWGGLLMERRLITGLAVKIFGSISSFLRFYWEINPTSKLSSCPSVVSLSSYWLSFSLTLWLATASMKNCSMLGLRLTFSVIARTLLLSKLMALKSNWSCQA